MVATWARDDEGDSRRPPAVFLALLTAKCSVRCSYNGGARNPENSWMDGVGTQSKLACIRCQQSADWPNAEHTAAVTVAQPNLNLHSIWFRWFSVWNDAPTPVGDG